MGIVILFCIFIWFVFVVIILLMFVNKYNREYSNKMDRRVRKVFVYTNAIIVFILPFCVLAWPLPGYSKEFSTNGDPFTYFDKFEQEHLITNGITRVKEVHTCMGQEDFDNDIKYANSFKYIESYRYYNDTKNCELINMSESNGNDIIVSRFDKYPLTNFGNQEFVSITLYDDLNENIDFKQSNIKWLRLSLGQDPKYTFSLNLEGIENMEGITLSKSSTEYYTYDFRNDELDEFLKYWGYLDKDGYYGKIYPMPDKEEKEKTIEVLNR